MSIIHPLEPIYNNDSKILILGSFPSVKSREVGFYYGHPQNRFWMVLGSVCRDTPEIYEKSIEEKRQFLIEEHIAVWDVIGSCNITGSSDSSISDVGVNDLGRLLRTSKIGVIYINGKTAYDYYYKYAYQKLYDEFGRKANAVLLPSTSPANAAWSLSKLIAAWSRIKTGLGLNPDAGHAILSMNEYCKAAYGHKLYKLSLDGGFTCPNRDGTLGSRGCIFCDGDGSGAFSGTKEKKVDTVTNQIEYQKSLIADKLPKEGAGYIAYFQAFTGTYADIQTLRNVYMEAITNPEIEVLSIATRPDCLGKEVLDLISQINRIKPVWIELGLQTIHSSTAKYIRRGYDLKTYDKAVSDLTKIGVSQIITHVILGLPNESKKMIIDTVSHVSRSMSNGIKLQLLHVLKGTDLETDYLENKFDVYSLEEYIDVLKGCIDVIPPDMVIHRLTGDGDKKRLVAPMWSADKKRVLNEINRALSDNKNGG